MNYFHCIQPDASLPNISVLPLQDYLHKMNVIHRDLKSKNCLARKEEVGGIFGISSQSASIDSCGIKLCDSNFTSVPQKKKCVLWVLSYQCLTRCC